MLARRRLLGAALAVPAIIRPARAGRTTTVLVGAAAGSLPDQGLRAFVPFLERHLPYTDIGVTNLPGEQGLTAYRTLARAEGAATLLAWLSTPSLVARMVDHRDPGLMRRITLLGAVQKEAIAIVSPAASPLTSVADIVSRSAERAEAVPLATPPAGSPPHLAALRLQAITGTRLNIVPFPSAGAARQAAVARTVAAAVLGLQDAIAPLREGRLVGLGVTTSRRSESFPDMAPLRELGVPLSAAILRGLAAPAGLPADAAARIEAAMQAICADPEFIAQGEAAGFSAVWMAGADWTAHAETQRSDFEHLWHDAPWLPAGTG